MWRPEVLTRSVRSPPDLPQRLSPSQRAGIVAAAATVPLSRVPLLRPRSWLDQAVVTTVASAVNYALTAALHDVVLGTSDRLLRLAGRGDGPVRTGRATLAVDLAGLTVAVAGQAVFRRREDETPRRALVRTTARMVAVACTSGAVPGVVDALTGRIGPGHPLGKVVRTVPAAAVVGAVISGGVQRVRAVRARSAGFEVYPERRAPMRPTLHGGVELVLGAVGPIWTERAVSRLAAASIRRLTGSLPTGPARHRSDVLGHAAAAVVLGAGVYGLGVLIYRRAETRLGIPDALLTEPPSAAGLSGSPGSAIDWHLLGREPRRHLAQVRSAAAIRAVMAEPARDPIRLYVGLTSAPSLTERVDLAMRELERTGALDRSLLVLVSPTGSGYVNYVASAAWEYLSRGDCASLTMQYSSRPSPMSLDRVDEGREQNRATWNAVAEELRRREPEGRPRVVLFGESLGAHTSQDAFLHTGTDGLRRNLIDRALWLGTPYASAWSRTAHAHGIGQVAPGGVLRVTCADDIDRLDPQAARAARYVLMEHDDDAIALFNLELLIREPSWLVEQRRRAVPGQARWSTPVTFLQTAVDVKNANNDDPGLFTSAGHDYRADLARAVRFAYGLSCSAAQLAAVEHALRREDRERADLWG